MPGMSQPLLPSEIPAAVEHALARQPIRDLHTHLYPPAFGTPVANASLPTDASGLMLWGIDELVTYHYLVAEVYRVVPSTVLPYERFWAMTKSQQADHIWKHLFVERTPISEACRGVLTSLTQLGLDPNEKSLEPYRAFFRQQDPSGYVDRVMQRANVSSITMTNPVFDDNERARWLADARVGSDPRFKAVLRIDPLLRDFPSAAKKMSAWGYDVSPDTGQKTIAEAQRFLRDWIDRQRAIYLAVSLPPAFRYPADPADPADPTDATTAAGQTMLERVVLPVCAERGLPFAMMIGSRLQVNPDLRDGGDMVGRADVESVVHLCRAFPLNRFLVTMLSRENQHELCVAARKFGNLLPFGCWWFLNNPSLIEEIQRMRLELLGTSFVPQHSDARILEQLLYKWEHTRTILGRVLVDKYRDLAATGFGVGRELIARDVKLLLEQNFTDFLAQ
jgi:hypothetical protein